MNVIIVSDNLRRSVEIPLPGSRFWVVAALLAAVLGFGTYQLAVRLAERWVETEDPRVAEMVERSRLRGEAERTVLWEQAIDSLQRQISDLEVRVWWLNELGGSIVSEMGIPPERLFPGSGIPLLGGEHLRDTSLGGTRQGALSRLSSSVAALAETGRRVERGFDSLNIYHGRRASMMATVPKEVPVDGYYWRTSGYGYRKDPFTGRRSFHSGYDYAAKRGTPIVAGADGIVTYQGRLGNYGKTVEVYHGWGISTLYGHLSAYRVGVGDFVARDDPIGIVGNTGRSTGRHLHYEVRVDGKPQPYSRTIKRILTERGLTHPQ